MQFHIMNNGIDSLQHGLEHYKEFLEKSDDINLSLDEYFSELKHATISIHDAIELFTKQILYDVNELLIFKVDYTDDFISKLLHVKYIDNKKDSHMDYFIAGKVEDTVYKTIDYKESIKILKSIFKKELPASTYSNLSLLGEMRNAMTHLGYWDDFRWYKIMIAINDTLDSVKAFYSVIIKNAEKYFYYETMQEIDHILALSSQHIENTWWAMWEYCIDALCLYIEENLSDSISDARFNIEEDSHALKRISFMVEGKSYELDVRVIPRYDAIVLIKNNIVVYAINMNKSKYSRDSSDSRVIYKSSNFYYFDKATEYSEGLSFDWDDKKALKVCDTNIHLINNLKELYRKALQKQ